MCGAGRSAQRAPLPPSLSPAHPARLDLGDAGRLLAAVVLRDDLLLRGGGALQRGAHQPAALRVLNVGPDLANHLRRAVAVQVVVLDLFFFLGGGEFRGGWWMCGGFGEVFGGLKLWVVGNKKKGEEDGAPPPVPATPQAIAAASSA